MVKMILSGPVIIEKGRLLVTNDGKDDFYKIPGGKVKEGESLEQTGLRELKEETGFECKLSKKLSTMKLNKKPGTGEEMKIELHHYLGELIIHPKDYKTFNHDGHKVRWIKLGELENYPLAPNIKYLIEKGEIK